MSIDRDALLKSFSEGYALAYDKLGPEGIDAILERGRRWHLAPVLKNGGLLSFPHVHLADCGPFTAAVVHACLNTDADRILAVSVLHPFTDEMENARLRVATGASRAEDEPLRGIFGPGLEHANDTRTWEKDHALYGFRRLLAEEAQRRGIKPPQLIERYPYLTGEHPETLPGIQELAEIAKDAVVISTADHCHHGVGYGDERQNALYFDESGIAEIRHRIEAGLTLLDEKQYLAYNRHCFEVTRSDWRDAGPVLHHLLGPLHSTVIDIIPSDFSTGIYNAPTPTWVAGALVMAETHD